MKGLAQTDAEVFRAIVNETDKQEHKLILIASENYVSEAVMEAVGSVLTNKYAEGYPGKRYYSGCEFADSVESLAIERVKKLFNADHANVQPHSGAQANMAVYFSVLNPGDTILSMNLSHGGHLTHGSPVNFSGKLYNIVFYGVDQKTEQIDFDVIRKLAREHKPKIIVCGASAYPRIIDFVAFSEIAKDVGAYLLADIAHIAGLIVANIHMSPAPMSDFITVTTHKTLRGPRGGVILCKGEYAKKIDSAVFPGMQGGPLIHVIAGKAVSFKEAMGADFLDYQKQIVTNAQVMADELIRRGHRLVSGGTDNHLFMIDVGVKGLTGDAVASSLYRSGICANKNTIPFDTKSPMVTSGVRFGTPAITTRGLKEKEAAIVAGLIADILDDIGDEKKIEHTRKFVAEFLDDFPIYKHRLPVA